MLSLPPLTLSSSLSQRFAASSQLHLTAGTRWTEPPILARRPLAEKCHDRELSHSVRRQLTERAVSFLPYRFVPPCVFFWDVARRVRCFARNRANSAPSSSSTERKKKHLLDDAVVIGHYFLLAPPAISIQPTSRAWKLPVAARSPRWLSSRCSMGSRCSLRS